MELPLGKIASQNSSGGKIWKKPIKYTVQIIFTVVNWLILVTPYMYNVLKLQKLKLTNLA